MIKFEKDKKEVFNIIKSTVNEMVDTIKPTFGPSSNKVIIDKNLYKMVVDDGVQIARDFEFKDPMKNAIVKLIRETAVTTNDRVGDGTTGSLIMLQGIINNLPKDFDGRKVELELKKGLKEVVENIKKHAIPIETKEEIKKVALISFDDEEIAEMIADLYFKLGKEAIITIDKSQTMETTTETTDGFKLKSGYISPYMVTDPQRMATEIESPHFLLTDYRITEANELLGVMNKMAKEGKTNLILIADNVEEQALATMVLNLPHVVNPQTGQPGKFMSVAIAIPNELDKKSYMEDLALLTGARMFTESKGDKLESFEVKDLGKSERIIIKREETVIIEPKGNKDDINTAIESIKTLIENEPNKTKKTELEKRLARFTNKLAVIKVGALTDNEQKALKYKIEDTINSVKVAMKNGVVCGSGGQLTDISTSSEILNMAIREPYIQLCDNMGLEYTYESKDNVKNLVTGEVGSFMNVGVIDPADVVIAGVESAVSIASLLVTCSGMIVEHEDEK